MSKLIGTKPNQVPTNGDLGSMAYMDYESVAPVLIGGRRNFLANGAMSVSQRGTTFSTPQNYTLDRYKSLRYAAGNYTISQQSAGLNNFDKCARLQRNSGDTSGNSFAYNQPLEARDTFGLRGKTVTFSCYIRAGADYSCADTTLRIGYHNTAGEYGVNYSNFTVSTAYAANESFDFRGQTDWIRLSITGPITSDAVQVCVSVQPQGFSGTAGSNDYIETTGWQLEIGSVATPFEHRSYGEELALCQRYYQVHNSSWASPIGLSVAYRVWQYQWPVTPRVNPTIVSYTYGGNQVIAPDSISANIYQGYAQWNSVGSGTFVAINDIHIDAEL